MAVDRRVLALLAAQKAELAAITDAQARALLVAWARAWDEIAVELDRAISDMIRQAQAGSPMISRAITARQAARALRVASQELESLILRTGTAATRPLLEMIRKGAGDAQNLTRIQLPGTLRASVVRVDVRQIEQIVKRTTEQITAQHVWLAADAEEAMRRELVRSLTVGANPREAARRMLERTHGVFQGGRNRALTIARTEQLDAYRRAAKISNQLNKEVLQGWRWIADLSERTCRSCLAMHGEEFPVHVDGPIDHAQGRCSRVPVTKSWEDLGFDNIDEPEDLTPDAEAWFRTLSEDTQRQILTNRGYEQWRAGNYPMSDWSSRRKAEGWRDSMVPSIPPRSATDGS